MGCYIQRLVSIALTRGRWRDRDGDLTQNMLALCDWRMLFRFILVGWEGSAADGKVFQFARERDLHIPDGFFYLADAGFLLSETLLTPYRNVRYHLKEWSGRQ